MYQMELCEEKQMDLTLHVVVHLSTAKILDQNLRREYFNYFQKIKKTFFSKNGGENRQHFDKATIRSSKFTASKRYPLKLYQPTEKTKNSAVAKTVSYTHLRAHET